MWDIVWVLPQGHRSVSVSHYFLLQAPQCPCSVQKRFSRDHCCRGRSKPGCRIVGWHTSYTDADIVKCFSLLLINRGTVVQICDFEHHFSHPSSHSFTPQFTLLHAPVHTPLYPVHTHSHTIAPLQLLQWLSPNVKFKKFCQKFKSKFPKSVPVFCTLAHRSHVPISWESREEEVKLIWQKAPHGGPILRLGVTPGGRKLYH